ncbi:dihydrofolate reductase family protein [Demequina aurantiaca]|uniref:dihydrofolate reductase family protein n=1 Tax=Demequina aurantiaca TaxID=676200 RepID=UPI0007823CC9|nr:dihydrofolate reductase family protein [Demequina aurantiaca]
MGRLIVEQIISVDGFAAEPDGGLGFVERAAGAETDDAGQLEMLKGVGAILLGANTYRMFSSYWPTPQSSSEAVAEPINRLPKHVFSNSSESAPWGDLAPATVEGGNPVEVAQRLTSAYKRDVIVWGSLELSQALLEAGVVDHLRLRIVPVLIGSGLGFADTLAHQAKLALVSAEPQPSGHVTLAYDVGR